jgi:hypothetical protein
MFPNAGNLEQKADVLAYLDTDKRQEDVTQGENIFDVLTHRDVVIPLVPIEAVVGAVRGVILVQLSPAKDFSFRCFHDLDLSLRDSRYVGFVARLLSA